MLRLPHRFLALLLTFGLGLNLYYVWNGLVNYRQAAQAQVEMVGVLIPARESHPQLEMSEPAASDFYMRLASQAQFSGPDINKPIPEPPPDPGLIRHSCGLLVISVDQGRSIKLNSEDMGTLDELGKLSAQVTQIFQEREASLAFKPGMERRDDVPMAERVERTVIIQPSRSLTYREVVSLIDAIKQAKANPIGLQVAGIEN